MKTVALLVYADVHPELLAEIRRQTALVPADEFSFEIFQDFDLDKSWKEAPGRDFYFWIHGELTLTDGILYKMLDDSSFLSDRALMAGTVKDGSGRLVSGGFGWNRSILTPDPVIPVPCRIFDGLLALIPGCVWEKIGVLGGRYRGQLAGFDYAIRARKAGFQTVIAPGIAATCAIRPNPERTLREDFFLDLHTKGPLQATWYLIRSAVRKLVIKKMSLYE